VDEQPLSNTQNDCFGDAPGEGKPSLFCFFFPEKRRYFLSPTQWLVFLYRTSRTRKVTLVSQCPYGIGFNNDGKIAPLFCGKWSCETCRVDLAKQWAWRASLHINNVQPQCYFWTLTLRSDVRTAVQGFTLLPKNWDSLRKTVSRKTGKWSYLAFVECHPNRTGIPHFHCLSLTPAPVVGAHISNPIKDLAWQAGFGFMATEEIIQGWKAAWYVAKYASKHDPAIPRNFRRCRCSRDWAKLPDLVLPAFLVKSRSERLVDFLLRVEELTGVDVDKLYQRYRIACNLFEVNNYGDE